ncbi:MAG TPA: zinc ribbon domain-containing protein, partial [Dictyobacter sp.]|nr:zinc ribbon domain-containing protein [Dictyobacter sp.]
LDAHSPMAVIFTSRLSDGTGQRLIQSHRLEHTIVTSDSYQAHLMDNFKICLSCRHEVPLHWNFCVYCGSTLARTCQHCNTMIVELEGSRYCSQCGTEWQG